MSIGFIFPPVPETEETINNLCPDSDPEDEDYIPSPSELSFSESDISEMDIDVEVDPLEASALEVENSTITWPTWEERKAKEQAETYAAELAALEAKEAHAPSIYNPDEVMSLIHEFYTLLIDMGYWPTGCLKPGPHNMDIDLLRHLGYTDSAIHILVNLPYIDSAAQTWDRQILRDTNFVDYTEEESLLTARHPDRPWDHWRVLSSRDAWQKFLVEGKMITLAWIGSRDGEFLVLDTENGLLRNFPFLGGLDLDAVEYKRHGSVSEDYEREHPTDFRRCKFISAADWFRNAIYNYRSLQVLPFLDLGPEDFLRLHPNNPNYEFEASKPDTQRRLEKQRLIDLYTECGWNTPTWQRNIFLKKYTRSKLLTQKRKAECEKIWLTSTPEVRKSLLTELEYTVAEENALQEEKVRERTRKYGERVRKDIEFGRFSKEEKKEKMKQWEESVEVERVSGERKVGRVEEFIRHKEEEIAKVDRKIEGLMRGEGDTEVEFEAREKRVNEDYGERKKSYLEFFDRQREEQKDDMEVE